MKGRIVKIDGGKYRVCSYKTGKPLAKHYSSKAEAWDARMALRADHYTKLNEEEE
jgi:hypothetical protein